MATIYSANNGVIHQPGIKDLFRLRKEGVWPFPFAPLAVSGCKLWLDASQITGKADGEAVSQWNDLSGNANHLLQATSTRQPLYKTGIKNSLPVVRFDGEDDWMATNAFTLDMPVTIFSVFQFLTLKGGYGFGSVYDGLTNNTANLVQSATTLSEYTGGIWGSQTVAAATFYAHVCVFNGESSYTKLAGGSKVTGSITNVSLGGFRLFCGDANAENANGDLAELLVYSGALSDEIVANALLYLQGKWGL